jgi:hypothetical protein
MPTFKLLRTFLIEGEIGPLYTRIILLQYTIKQHMTDTRLKMHDYIKDFFLGLIVQC